MFQKPQKGSDEEFLVKMGGGGRNSYRGLSIEEKKALPSINNLWIFNNALYSASLSFITLGVGKKDIKGGWPYRGLPTEGVFKPAHYAIVITIVRFKGSYCWGGQAR